MKLFRDLAPLLNPKSIAVVGASERHGSAGRTVLENLCNLEKLIGQRFTFIGLPLKIRNGTGSPIRAVAIVGK